MEEKIKELKKELLNKEVSLLNFDNTVEQILDTSESLYEYLEETLEQKSFGYVTGFENNDTQAVIFEFNILDKDYKTKLKNDDIYKFDMLIKITNIWEN